MYLCNSVGDTLIQLLSVCLYTKVPTRIALGKSKHNYIANKLFGANQRRNQKVTPPHKRVRSQCNAPQ